MNGDGCTSCSTDDSYECTRVDNTASNPDSCIHRCGNSALDQIGSYSEQCDDGNVNSNDGCSSSCMTEDAFTCSRSDNTAANPDVCTPRCGNSALDPFNSHTEQCDDGNIANSDGCSSTCVIEDPVICSRVDHTNSNPDSCSHRCGNGELESIGSYTEQCDD